MSAARIRVLVIDDSAFARKVIREILEADARFEVVGIARDGLDGLEKIVELQPDVVTLDLLMPNLDGLGLLGSLSALVVAKLPRVVVVSMTAGDSDLAILALQGGAVELVHKPTALANDRLFDLADELCTTVALAASATATLGNGLRTFSPIPSRLMPQSSRRDIVVVGASTGGPQALTSLLRRMPEDFPAPVAITLHMPVGYTEALARRLDQLCALEVVEAYEGVELLPGRVVLARAGIHLKVRPGDPPRARLDLVPLDTHYRPSVDVLFSSAAAAFGEACVGVVLTGMGDDGLLGSRDLRAANAVVLTEAESSCVVYGMPRSVKDAGMSSAEATLDGMMEAILRAL